MQVYPDAAMVVTHRDPVAVLASNCSFSTFLRGKFSDHVDRAEIGQQMKDLVGRHIRALVDFDANRGGQPAIAHVDYHQVVADPGGGDGRGLRSLDLELTPQSASSIADVARREPAGQTRRAYLRSQRLWARCAAKWRRNSPSTPSASTSPARPGHDRDAHAAGFAALLEELAGVHQRLSSLC